jgi:uncharacterized membrane protein
MLTTLVGLVIAGVIAVAVIGVIMSIIGLTGFLLFKVLPLVAIGYVAVKLLRPKHKRLSAEDRKWLES